MCERFAINRQQHVYIATDKHNEATYRRAMSTPRRWFQFGKLVRHTGLIDTLENAVCEYEQQYHHASPVRSHGLPRAPIVPGRLPVVRRNARGEGNRYE